MVGSPLAYHTSSCFFSYYPGTNMGFVFVSPPPPPPKLQSLYLFTAKRNFICVKFVLQAD